MPSRLAPAGARQQHVDVVAPTRSSPHTPNGDAQSRVAILHFTILSHSRSTPARGRAVTSDSCMPISFRSAQSNGSSVWRRSCGALAIALLGVALATAPPLPAQEAATTTRAERADPLTLRDVLVGVRREHPIAQAASARIDAARVEPGYKGNQLGLPTFLLGGAIISTIFSGIQAFIRWAFSDTTGSVILAGVLAVVFGALAWAALYAAGVARRRIRLSTDQSIRALWETIGACGNPPKDSSYDFAVYAIILLTLTWLLVPLVTWLIVTRGF